MTDDNVLSALKLALNSQRATTARRQTDFRESHFSLLNERFLESELTLPRKCPHSGCDASCTTEVSGSEVYITCDLEDHPHEFTHRTERYQRYRLNFEEALHYLAECAGVSDGRLQLNSELPHYIAGVNNDGLNVVLLVDVTNPTQRVTDIYIQALQENQPTLLIAPLEDVSPLVEMQSLFALGSLVFTIPIEILSNGDQHVQRPIETMFSIKELESQYLQQQSGDPDTFIKRVNSNPRHVLAELNHMRLLRVNKEIPRSSGERLEKAMAAGLSNLFPTTLVGGGEDARGSGVPDKLFYIPHGGQKSKLYSESILGIVDSKSGATANFGSEETEGKHDEYLDSAKYQHIPYDRIAHTFVVLGFDGQQELEFFDKMESNYGEQDFLLIITADALTLLLGTYLSTTVSNEIQLISGSFREAVYPLFNISAFNELDNDAGYEHKYRPVGKQQDRYNREYDRRRMLILHQDLVREHLERCLNSPKSIEKIFESYFEPKPIV